MDTTVLIDILKDEYPENQERLYNALKKGEELVAPVIVYAELMPQFRGDTALLNLFLKEHRIKIEPLDIDSVKESAIRWMRYLKRKTKVRCHRCGEVLDSREHFLSDFFIGGYALTSCDAIITRDRGIYKKYFPELKYYV